MFKKVSMSLVAMVALSACSACSTLPESDVTASAEEAQSWDMGSASMVGAEGSDMSSSKGAAGMAAVLSNSVQFGFDSAALSEANQANLRLIAAKIKATNPAKIVVEGHCDERGTREYNLALGDRRAVAAKKYLVGLGVDSSKISTISYGKERPLDASHNAEAWAKNRRATVVME